MVDLQTASALVDLALEHRVGVAMVGDPYQAQPVGHVGVMASAVRYATASIELDSVHRFSDPEYGALTLRLRNPRDLDDALTVAGELLERGHVRRVRSAEEARDAMVAAHLDGHARGKRVAVVSGTNGEADAINDAIQQHRVDAGELDPTMLALGMGGSASSSATSCRRAATTRAPGWRTARSGWCAESPATPSRWSRPATAATCGA